VTPNAGAPATYRKLLAFVMRIADQSTVAEIEADPEAGDDYEGAYDTIVKEARELLGGDDPVSPFRSESSAKELPNDQR
jgi:hypothetical protein